MDILNAQPGEPDGDDHRSDRRVSDTEKLTMKDIAQKYPEAYKQIFDRGRAEGERTERDLFAALKDTCGQDLELLCQCYSEGRTIQEALELYITKSEQINSELSAKLNKLQEGRMVPAIQEFSEEKI